MQITLKNKSQKEFLFQVFAYYGRQHMVFVCDFLCVFAKFEQKFYKNLVKVK